jgi:regulator of protease activity HflC (stomatin/prohibitin superfamily)
VQRAGARGVQPETLGPGTYFNLNPYEVRVDLVDARSQRYDMLKEEAIEFPSNDGFTIRMEANVEWAVYPDRVPAMLVEVGDLEDVVAKVIRPYAMSLARIQGSKMTARDFIGARETFQKRLVADLRAKCRDQGVLIKAVNVRDLQPPEAVRSVIRERELADQMMTRYENEIAEAVAKAQLVEQEQLANQQKAVGDANRQVVTAVVEAQQSMAVAITEANQRLDVAKLTLEAARKQAEAILARGQADAKVVLFNYQAKAEPLQAAVNAFGDGQTYARYNFLQKVAPAVRSILTSTDGPLAEILQEFSDGGRAATPAAPAPTAENRRRDAGATAGDSGRDAGPPTEQASTLKGGDQ